VAIGENYRVESKNLIPKRVLHVIDHFGYGGAQIIVKNIIENINIHRFKLTVCILRKVDKPISLDNIEMDCHVINLDCNQYDFSTVFKIVQICKRREIDLVHAHLQKSIVSSLLASYFCKSKIIIHEHGGIFKKKSSGWLYPFCLRILKRRPYRVFVNSKASMKVFVERTGFQKNKISVVYNFIDEDKFIPEKFSYETSRKLLNLSQKTKVIGFVGRLDYCKGVDVLLNATVLLKKHFNDFKVVIVGDGKERQSLEAMTIALNITKHVVFLGMKENPAEFMAGFDLAVIPSRREAFGVTVLEFMRMSVPVVVNPIGGIVELVENGKTGIFLETLLPENLALHITCLINDMTLRKSIIERAKQYSFKFSRKEKIIQLENEYAKIT